MTFVCVIAIPIIRDNPLLCCYLVLDFRNRSPGPPVDGVGEVAIPDRLIVLEPVAVVFCVESGCVVVGRVCLYTHVQLVELLGRLKSRTQRNVDI